MKKTMLLVILSLLFSFMSFSQNISQPSYTDHGEKFLSSIFYDSLQVLHFPFGDTLRGRWERLPDSEWD